MTIDMNMNNRLELGKLICFSYAFFLLICRSYLYHARVFCSVPVLHGISGVWSVLWLSIDPSFEIVVL